MTKEQLVNSKGKYFVHQKGADLACIEKIEGVKFLRPANSSSIPVQIYYRDTSTLIFSIDRVTFCNIFDSIDEAKLYIELKGYTEVPNITKRNDDIIGAEIVEDIYFPE